MKYKYEIQKGNSGFYIIKLPNEIKLVELVFDDMASFAQPIFLNYIQNVLNEKVEYEEVTGNICTLEIHKDITRIEAEFVNKGMSHECEIETKELNELIELWIQINNL